MRDSYFILDVLEDDEPSLVVLTPATVLPIRSREQLESQLEVFSDPVKNKAIQNTTKARRWYVEKILPVLRFYCSRYEVEVPDWLVSNNHWTSMTKREQERLFGPGELKLREFQPVNCPDIAVVREEQQDGG